MKTGEPKANRVSGVLIAGPYAGGWGGGVGGGGALGAHAPPPKKKFHSETSKRGKKVPPSTVGRQKRMQVPLRYDKIKTKLGKGKKEERRIKRKGVKERG